MEMIWKIQFIPNAYLISYSLGLALPLIFYFWLEANLGPSGNFYTNIYIYIYTHLCVRAKLFFSLFLLLFILRTLFFHLYVRIKIFNF